MKPTDIITIDPGILRGTPVFRGTRVPVKALFKDLEHGHTLGEFLQRHPTVSRRKARLILRQVTARFASRPNGVTHGHNFPGHPRGNPAAITRTPRDHPARAGAPPRGR